MGTEAIVPKSGSEIRSVERPDNEILSYRAVSARAIVSLVLGLFSLLSFANPLFWIAAVLAVVFGALALGTIRRQPDAFSGAGMARAGIVLGLIFGLSSFMHSFVTDWLLRRRADHFVQSSLLPRLQDRDLNSALYYKQDPVSRRGITPEEIRKKLEENGIEGTPAFEMQAGEIARLMDHLKREPEARLVFEAIEQTGSEGTTPVALARIRIDWPAESAHDHDGPHDAESERVHRYYLSQRGDFLGLILKNRQEGRRDSWWVDRYAYPYRPNSYAPKPKPVDDGHGHGH